MKAKAPLHLMLHKPAGFECSHAPTHYPSVFSLLPPELLRQGVQCAGRLDADTTGILLFSNVGSFIHSIEHPKKHLGKTYHATLAEPLVNEAREKLLAGVNLRNERHPCIARSLEFLNAEGTQVSLTIFEGVYHQVKRMFASVGNRVEALHRHSIGNLGLGGLEPGNFRFLTDEDFARLQHTVAVLQQLVLA